MKEPEAVQKYLKSSMKHAEVMFPVEDEDYLCENVLDSLLASLEDLALRHSRLRE